MSYVFTQGLCVTVNEGGPIPTDLQIARFLPNRGTVRDVIGWHKVETAPGVYSLPAYFPLFHAATVNAGCQHLVTLGFGNTLYTPTNTSFPRGPAAVAAFARYAAFIAAAVPDLAALSIDNEVNGSYDTGSPTDREQDYAALLLATVPAIRAANPSVKIIAGATVGWNIDGWFVKINKLYPWSAVDYLDAHPYFSSAQLLTWTRQLAIIRRAGIANPFWFTEHGGSIAHGLGAAYWPLYADIVAADAVPPAGGNYFLLQSAGKFGSGLLDPQGLETDLGASWP